MTNSTSHHHHTKKPYGIGVNIGVEILFLLLYVVALLVIWFKRVFKTDDDVLTRHHIIHQKNLLEQQAAFEGMQKENYVQAPPTT